MSIILIDLLTTMSDASDKNDNASVFKSLKLPINNLNGMLISDRQGSLNFRHRLSEPGYKSDWHVAGDPTLIIIRQGQLTLELKDGTCRTYHVGEQFIAADYSIGEHLAPRQGHKAYVEGSQALMAVHIKLANDVKEWHEKMQAFIV